MEKKLYKLMNWPEIEGVVYSENHHPHMILGPHVVGSNTLIQMFWPDAIEVLVKLTNTEKLVKMDRMDEAGFFACLIPGKLKQHYTYIITKDTQEIVEIEDAYQYQPEITKEDTDRFRAGTHYQLFDILGSREKTFHGVNGIEFAVWAPTAMRVSVVGDFNNWDGRTYPMMRLWDSGIYWIFIPGLQENQEYQYEIKAKGGMVYVKADPFEKAGAIAPKVVSIVKNIDGFSWTDQDFINKRNEIQGDQRPISVYELHLNAFAGKENGKYYNYRTLAQKVIPYIKKMGYTHIEIMPIMEYLTDASLGYNVVGYYAPTSRYGSPEDFMYFINEMHQADIAVILDWVPGFFPKDNMGLSAFDGSFLYEQYDEKKRYHSKWNTLLFNYGRNEVSNFLIANAIFWIEKYHVDGIRIGEVASMLYLNYGKKEGEWSPNIYGGTENLEAVEFIKHLNSILHQKYPSVITVAEEVTAWPMVTGSLSEGGLGFSYKWNNGWSNDLIEYLKYDPYFRSHHHSQLTYSMVYAYSEKFILSFSHNEVVRGKSSMLGKMPGEIKDKFSNLRAAYGYMFTHPGKKHLFMGQDLGAFEAWSDDKEIQWSLLDYHEHKSLNTYIKTLNGLYQSYPALYEFDYQTKGFEWINNFSANECILVFLRKTLKQEDTLLVVVNFANKTHEDYKIGVPFAGKYKEILNSDQEEFGGNGDVNKRLKTSKLSECDGRDQSITIQVAALSTMIFQFVPFTEKEQEKNDTKKKSKESDKEAKKTNLVDEIAKQFQVCEEKILSGSEFVPEEVVKEKREKKKSRIKNE